MIRRFFSTFLCVILLSTAACAQAPNDRGLEPLTINDAAKVLLKLSHSSRSRAVRHHFAPYCLKEGSLSADG